MPCFYSHALNARSALESSGYAMSPSAQKYYYIGAQGPDPFLFFALKTRRNMRFISLGDRLHEAHAAPVLRALLSACENELLEAYMLGFLTHYALDITAHPYVNANADEKQHTHFETQLDIAYLNHIGAKLSDMPPCKLLPSDNGEASAIDGLLCATLPALGFDMRRGMFTRAYRSMRHSLALLYDPDGKKRTFYGLVEKALGCQNAFTGPLFNELPTKEDMLNLQHAPYSAPSGIRSESYPELMFEASVLSAEFMLSALQAWHSGNLAPALSLLGDRSFDTGA